MYLQCEALDKQSERILWWRWVEYPIVDPYTPEEMAAREAKKEKARQERLDKKRLEREKRKAQVRSIGNIQF